MGSPFHLIFYTDDSSKANMLAAQSFRLVDSLNQVFSDYLAESELSRLSATAGSDSFISVSPHLYSIITNSKKAWLDSRGAFDITIGPLSRLWRTARKEKRFPSGQEIKKAKALTGFENVMVDSADHRIKLLLPGMQLDLGGIAKGYVTEAVVHFMRSKGIVSVLADAGGDIVCGDAPPGKNGWTIGVNLPENPERLWKNTLEIKEKAVATSGDAYQYAEHEGKRYSHIIDPVTGYGVTSRRNVTVIAADGGTADWLATACSIVSLRNAKKLARKYKADLLIVYIKNNRKKLYMTPHMKTLWKRSQIKRHSLFLKQKERR